MRGTIAQFRLGVQQTNKKITPDRTRTHNYRLRNPTPYPLGHRGYFRIFQHRPLHHAAPQSLVDGTHTRRPVRVVEARRYVRSSSVTVITGDSQSLYPGPIASRTWIFDTASESIGLFLFLSRFARLKKKLSLEGLESQ